MLLGFFTNTIVSAVSMLPMDNSSVYDVLIFMCTDLARVNWSYPFFNGQ